MTSAWWCQQPAIEKVCAELIWRESARTSRPAKEILAGPASAAKLVSAPVLNPKLAELQLEADTTACASTDEIFTATGLDARIAEFQWLAEKSAHMAKEQTALAATMTSLGAELAASRSRVATPATPSLPRRRDAAVELRVEAQHVLLHVSDKITAELLANRGVKPVKQGIGDCGVCAASKMCTSAVQASGWPRPAAGAVAHVCREVNSSGDVAGLNGAVSSE